MAKDMVQKEKIKNFVRKTLGCICPEEVFSSIKCYSNIMLNDVMISSKIYIGNRLLIYIVDANSSDSIYIKNSVTFLVDTGKRERDNLGFNRFRLVLATDNVNEMKQSVDNMFKILEKDEKVHLHVIHKKDIPF